MAILNHNYPCKCFDVRAVRCKALTAFGARAPFSTMLENQIPSAFSLFNLVTKVWSNPDSSGEESISLLCHLPHPTASTTCRIKHSYRNVRLVFKSLKREEGTDFSILWRMVKLLGQRCPEKAHLATEPCAVCVVLHVLGCWVKLLSLQRSIL